MILFTRHALERMKQRGVTQSDVEAVVIGEAMSAVPDGSGNLVMQKRFRNRILRVHFRIVNSDRLMVTPYWSSKLKKYPA